MSSINIETLLYEEIQHDFDAVNGLEPGTEQHKAAAETALKMMDRALEIIKIENEVKAREKALESEQKMKRDQLESEQRIKQQQLDDEKKDRVIKNIITVLGIVASIGGTVWGVKRTFEFEKEGTVTTIMGRSLIQKLIPKK